MFKVRNNTDEVNRLLRMSLHMKCPNYRHTKTMLIHYTKNDPNYEILYTSKSIPFYPLGM